MWLMSQQEAGTPDELTAVAGHHAPQITSNLQAPGRPVSAPKDSCPGISMPPSLLRHPLETTEMSCVEASEKVEFPADGSAHKTQLVACNISANDQFIMTCATGDDTMVKLWTPKGVPIASFDNKQGSHNGAAVSTDGRFIAIAAWTSDVKIMEVTYAKNGLAEGVKKAMDLKGPRSGITGVSFSDDCARVATCSKDGSWRVYNILVRYTMQEDPRLLKQGAAPQGSAYQRAALSPHGQYLALTLGTTVEIVNVETGETVDTIADAHAGEIVGIQFSSDGTMLVTAGKDRVVHTWHVSDTPGVL